MTKQSRDSICVDISPEVVYTFDVYQMCWVFACGCIEAALQKGNMTSEEADSLRLCLMNNEYPPGPLVKKSFPMPFAWLTQNDMAHTARNMRDYWANHHRDDKTPVYTVGFIRKSDTHPIALHVVRVDTGEEETVLNPHGYRFEKGDRMYVHAGIAALPA